MGNKLKQKILESIKNEKLKMKSKARFILESSLIIFGLVLITLFVLYITSFIIFFLRTSGALFAPSFGFRGVAILLLTAPWILIVLGITLIIILELLAKHFSFVYRRPILYSLLIIISLSTLGGVLIDQTNIHNSLFLRAKQDRLPIAGHLYTSMHQGRPQNLNIGIVLNVSSTTITIQDIQENTLGVEVSDQTKFAPNYAIETIKTNDIILILGEKKDEIIKAQNIKKINTTKLPSLKPRMKEILE